MGLGVVDVDNADGESESVVNGRKSVVFFNANASSASSDLD